MPGRQVIDRVVELHTESVTREEAIDRIFGRVCQMRINQRQGSGQQTPVFERFEP